MNDAHGLTVRHQAVDVPESPADLASLTCFSVAAVEPSVSLGARSLYAKAGFGDGDLLDDLLEQHLPEWDRLYRDLPESQPTRRAAGDYGFRHNLLITLVEGFLLPALPIELRTDRIVGTHNPIRAEDGETLPHDMQDFDVRVPVSVVVQIATMMLKGKYKRPVTLSELQISFREGPVAAGAQRLPRPRG